MRIYDIYGIVGYGLDEVARYLSGVLGVELTYRSSEFLGNHYRYKSSDGESLTLNENFDANQGEYLLPDHRDQQLLLYVSNTDRAEEIEDRLLASELTVTLLRRQTSDEIENADGSGDW